ncbi:MAG: SUMF1/EgtB/PvdO family nonheme iron enzyme, partial [Opitutales bacterium]
GGTYGRTPLTLAEVPTGAHNYTLMMRGYLDASLNGTVKEGSTLKLSATLVGTSKGAVPGLAWKVPDCGIEMVWITAGTFLMGSPEDEAERSSDETQHSVTISKGYWLGKYVVTQAQWQAVMGNNPSFFSGAGGNAPVEQISWDDAMEFCRKLTEKERAAERIPLGYEYSLPTEAQWEYACRAGTKTPFHYGSSLDSGMANFDGDKPYGNGAKGEARGKTSTVGLFKPNAWGLYDMHGNVWEWCIDWFGDYPPGSATDPVGLATGTSRSFRGGCWFYGANYCRSAFRNRGSPDIRFSDLGFRLAIRPVDPSANSSAAARPAANQAIDASGKPAPGRKWTVPDSSIDMVWVAPGTFTMGSPESEPERTGDETQHSVKISKGFWLGKYEVTQGQWESVMGNNPSYFDTAGSDAPVEEVSWDDAMEFCHKLTDTERAAGRIPAGYEYSLPTEAQWEYACRAGTSTLFSFGSDADNMYQYGNYCDSSNTNGFDWQDKSHDDGTDKTALAGHYKPNAWGLYDMHGNVWEWCYDLHGSYPSDAVTDPSGDAEDTLHIFRGGSW